MTKNLGPERGRKVVIIIMQVAVENIFETTGVNLVGVDLVILFLLNSE